MNLKEYIFKRENPVIFDKKGEFVYFPTNKVMQTTLARNVLSDRCIVFKDNNATWIETFNKTDFDNVYKFGITRHPVTKFESAFNYLKKQPKLSKRMGIYNTTINDYVKNIVINCNNPFTLNEHFEKQYDSFYFNDELIVDDLFKMENKEEINKMYIKLGICDNREEHFNKTEHYDKLDEECIFIIEQIYSHDLVLYK